MYDHDMSRRRRPTGSGPERAAGSAADGEAAGGEGEEEPHSGRLLRIATSCPRCGSRPALRITEEAARGLGGHAQRTRLGTYQCQHRGCKTIYDLYLTRGLLNEELGGVA
ncbi:MAG TPA: hypothetical protein VF263_01965 [Longimicrobiaceae bacterium]